MFVHIVGPQVLPFFKAAPGPRPGRKEADGIGNLNLHGCAFGAVGIDGFRTQADVLSDLFIHCQEQLRVMNFALAAAMKHNPFDFLRSHHGPHSRSSGRTPKVILDQRKPDKIFSGRPDDKCLGSCHVNLFGYLLLGGIGVLSPQMSRIMDFHLPVGYLKVNRRLAFPFKNDHIIPGGFDLGSYFPS